MSHEQLADNTTPVMIGQSAAMSRLRAMIDRVADTRETVLIMGENGTGKELVARCLHEKSRRKNSPWVAINCPALSAQLTESELFGHRKGAFTGADYDRVGRFEMAHGGSLLLDEISEIDVVLQSKLLRVLQERTFERVGSSETVAADVRVIATTNRDLTAEIAAGKFREDLYYRLAVLPIVVPPLRKRCEDVPELIEHFARKAAERLDQQTLRFNDGAVNLLCEYSWPGNVRQLENLVTRATLFADNETVSADEVRGWLFEHSGMHTQKQTTTTCQNQSDAQNNRLISARFSHERGLVEWHEESVNTRQNATPDISPENAALPFLGMTLDEMESQLIRLTLEQFGGHRAKTAAALGIGLRTLTNKIKGIRYQTSDLGYQEQTSEPKSETRSPKPEAQRSPR
jgi:Response regulator containing CheY-like receiver, AAA-type ATPase, and DNA-binding domains